MMLSMGAAVSLRSRAAHAQAANLVWKPYLQQVTDTSAVVLWTTQSGSAAAVDYGTTASYGSTASGDIRTLDTLNYRLNRVELHGLAPNTTYYYSIQTDGAAMLPDQVLKFKTAPSNGSDTPVTFLAFGDYGLGTRTQRNLRDHMLTEPFDFIVTTGDNAYSRGAYDEFDTRVFQVYGDLFSRGGVFPAPGNHDTYTANSTPYLDLFDLPTNALRAADSERYYSFDYGSMHIVVLDTNAPLNVTDADATDDMFDWLRADLSATRQPWKIAVFHSPPYSTGNVHGSDGRVRSRLIPVFEQYGVQLVLTGHDHIYERSKPLRGGQVITAAQGGITYVVSGAGSAASYGCGNAAWVATRVCSANYGIYNRVTVTPATLKVEAVRDNGNVIDTFALTNTSSAPPATPIDLPGHIEAEDYRAGGEGIGYHDTTAGNTGGAYRQDDVDIESCADGANCSNVGWIAAGEWLQYDVNVTTAGTYMWKARVAAPDSGKSFHIEVDGQRGGTIAVPDTGGWQTWATASSEPVTLSAGTHRLRVVFDDERINVNSIELVPTN
jgi:3',5'-cyclic AMP phosphodiesterase CpdA